MVRSILNTIGIYVAILAYTFGIRQSVTLENLKYAYPELSSGERNKIAKASYRNLAIIFAEMLYLRFASRKNIAKHITVTNPELFHHSIDQGKGLIVVAGHFANWEWLALGGALSLKKSFAVVRKNIHAWEKFMEKMRLRTGNELINSGDIRKMYRIINNGGCIAMLADQAAPGESVRVNFFGREVPTFEGPARLALRTRAAMLFAACLRTENGDYAITFHPILFDDLIGDNHDNIKELTARHTRMLEEVIRLHPDQWLWQHKRWKYV